MCAKFLDIILDIFVKGYDEKDSYNHICKGRLRYICGNS